METTIRTLFSVQQRTLAAARCLASAGWALWHYRAGLIVILVSALLVSAPSPVRAQIHTTQETFILSNESGGLISKLVANGYGQFNIYQTLVTLQGNTDPSIDAILTDTFLAALQSCPDSAEIYTHKLSEYTSAGITLAISTDGTVLVDSIFGREYAGKTGISTLSASISGVGRGWFTFSTDGSTPLTTFSVTSGSATTAYEVLAIGWAPAVARTFILSNEGSNGLVSQLVNAGYGDYNLYEALVHIQQNTEPSTAEVITDAFLSSLQSCPDTSAIFTHQLSEYTGAGVAVALSTDGTVRVDSIYGSTYQGTSGTSTLASTISGAGRAQFVYSSTSGDTLTSFSANGTSYRVFGIGFAGEQTFVLSNEGSNGLISQLVDAGYGSYNLYQGLIAIQQTTDPSVCGIITDAFLTTLSICPDTDEIFTTPLSNYNSSGIALAISSDGTVQTVSIYGAAYQGASGTSTLASTISGVGTANFTYATSKGTPLTSFTSGDTVYNVFAVSWSNNSSDVSNEGLVPHCYALSQNYPNPFNPSTIIRYQLPAVGNVTLRVYDELGREVATLVNERQNAGSYSVTFNAAYLSSGVYFYRLRAGMYHDTRKLLLLK